MHGRPLVHRDDGFRSRRAVAQSTVRSLGVIVFSPLFDQDLRLAQAVEDFTVEQLVSETCVEALAVAILPRRSRLDVGRLGADGCDPVADSLGDELGSVARREEALF